MLAYCARALLCVTATVAFLIVMSPLAIAGCQRCACGPAGCGFRQPTLRVDQGPTYNEVVVAPEDPSQPPPLRPYRYMRTWYGYPYWWTTRIVAAGPSMVTARSHRRCRRCGEPDPDGAH